MMQGWAATPPSRAQSYSVSCAEGHRLQGQRTEGYQALRCPTCGEGIFVLPRSPLPEPPVPASTPRSRVAAAFEAFPEDEPHVLSDPPAFVDVATETDGPEAEEEEAEIDWVDEVPTYAEAPEAPQSPPVAPVRKKPAGPPSKGGRPAAAHAKAPGPTGSKREADRPKPPEPAVLVVERPSLREWASSHRNALLVAAVLLLIVATVTIRWRRQRLEELPQIAEIGRTEGLKKLDAGEFHAAKKLLADAADAVEGLGGRYEGAESIRQGALEAAIFADLAPKGIDEILEEAATGDPKEWPSRFATLYKGRSVILDPPIAETPDPGRPGSGYQVNCPIYFGRGPRADGKGRIDLAGFRLFELAQPKVDEQKPFGARYASVELDLTSNEWVVTFAPDSGVFITHPRALEAIDWGASEPQEEAGP